MCKTTLNPLRVLTLLFALLFCNAAFSQDDIIMLNNDVVKAKVDEVGLDIIKYRKLDNLDGPEYDLPRGNVYMIIYSNGSRDVINEQPNGGANNAPPPANGTEDNMPAPPDGVNTNATINTPPPPMPVYEQPYCPVEGYLWTPGYWAYGPYGYYWVPGVWVAPPRPGYLWTPGYWGFEFGLYRWHHGYWGEHIGYYGGVYYGYGYYGSGYYGGRWEGGYFRYNTSVSRVDVTVVHNTYIDNTVVNNTTVNPASYNGAGGVTAEPTVGERTAMNEPHLNVTPEQQTHIAAARSDKNQYVSVNKGMPAVAAVNKPGGQAFSPEGHITTAHPNTSGSMGPVQHTAEPIAPAKQNNTEMKQPGATPAPAQKQVTPASAQRQATSAPAQKAEMNAPPQQQTKSAPGNTTRQGARSNYKPAKKAARSGQKSNSNPAPQHR